MRNGAGNRLDSSGNHTLDEFNDTTDQVDNLLEELNEFVAHPRRESRQNRLLYQEEDEEELMSPMLPRRLSMAKEEDREVNQNDESAVIKLIEDCDNIKLRRTSL